MKKEMRPFFSPLPNHVQSQGGNGLAPQQPVLSTPNQLQFSSCAQHNPSGFNNSYQTPPQSHGMNNPFQTPSVSQHNPSGFNNMAVPNLMHLMPSHSFPNGANIPLLVQNGHMGLNLPQGHSCSDHQFQNLNQIAALPLHGQACGMPQNLNQILFQQLNGQFDLMGRLQNMYQVPPPVAGGQLWPQNMPQGQFMGLPHGQFCSQNPMLPVNQNMPQQCLQHPFGSIQLGPFNSHPSVHPMGVGPGLQNTQMGLQNSNLNSNSSLSDTQKKNQDQCMFSEPTPMVLKPVPDSSVAMQNSWSPIIPGSTQMPQTQKNFHSSGFQQPQKVPQGQFMCLPHGQFCSQNPMLPVNQNVPQQCFQHPFGSTQLGPFNSRPSVHPLGVGPGLQNTQMGLQNSNLNPNSSLSATQKKNQDQCGFSEPTPMVQNPVPDSSVAVQNSWSPIIPGSTQMPRTQKNFHSSGFHQPQVNHVEEHVGDSNVSSENSKNFPRNPHGFQKRDQSHKRFQKSQFHHMTNAKGNCRPPTGNWGKGQKNGTDRKPQIGKSGKQVLEECQRPLSLNYTEQEIKQWREARKKNFPTTANIKKKLTGSDRNQQVTDGDAKIRRQELKDILAKQAELGLEVAEIPGGYLFEPEDQIHGGGADDNKGAQKMNDPYQKRFNKRGRHGRDKWRVRKKEKLENKKPPVVPSPIKREPTLLQKLLSADIKRDKSRLLQVFRFMTLNSFFDHWPDIKPLVFPLVTAKDGNVSGQSLHVAAALEMGESTIVDEIGGPKESSVVNEAEEEASTSDSDDEGDEEEVDCNSIKKMDYVTEQAEKSEEGEITD